jgi:putative Mn2+ efflux pump MntP
MCPICWINGFLLLLFGASAFSFGTEWYIVIPSAVLLVYGCYKIWEGIKKGKHYSDQQKINSRRTIILFIIGVAVGIYTGAAIMFAIASAEHQRMHDLLEDSGIEEPDHH